MSTQVTEPAPVKKPARRGGRVRVFTPEVLRTIPIWVSEGATRHDIAAALGVTLNSLQFTCSQHGIPLGAQWSIQGFERRLGRVRWAEIQRRARDRGVTPLQLMLHLLTLLIDDKLLDAILDDADDEENAA